MLTSDDVLRLGQVWRIDRETFEPTQVAVIGRASGGMVAVRSGPETSIVHPCEVHASREIALGVAKQQAIDLRDYFRRRLAAAEVFLSGKVDDEPIEALEVRPLSEVAP